MSRVFSNKVDMSLDDIIKLTKLQKRKQANNARRQGRGNKAKVANQLQRGGGGARNKGRGTGAGRGIKHTVNPIKQFHTNLYKGIRGRGRGRGINRQSLGTNQLNQSNTTQQNFGGRGRKRGRGGRNTGLVFTNNRVKQQFGQQQTLNQQQSVQQRQRLNKVRQQAALLREKKLAIQNLQRAQKNVQTINLAIQKTSRDNVVNQMRGITGNLTGNTIGQGQRKLLASLKRQGIDSQSNNSQPSRQLSQTSVTITNLSAINKTSNNSARRLQRWRRKKTQVASDHFTIEVANQSLQPVRRQNSLINELKLLKPAVATVYKFEKNVFATPSTAVSLNDRFSGRSFPEDDNTLEDRKVFI